MVVNKEATPLHSETVDLVRLILAYRNSIILGTKTSLEGERANGIVQF